MQYGNIILLVFNHKMPITLQSNISKSYCGTNNKTKII